MPSDMLKTIVDMMRAQRSVIPLEIDAATMRAGMEQMTGLMPLPADVTAEPVHVDGVPAEWVHVPTASAERVVLYVHGGAYVIGSLNTHRDLAGRISRAAAARVLNVDYRLAPEHPHPAAVEDATAAYRWLLDQAVAPERIVIAGDSAGGGLTVATLLALRDARVPLPAGGVCISPWVDLTCGGASYATKADADPIVTRAGVAQMAQAYLGATPPRTPLASPLFADLRGLPPLLIQVGTDEVLLDDAVQLADRAKAAGVETTLEVHDRMIHVWHWFLPMLDEAQTAVDTIGRFVRRHA
jgi:acetyl esterase/lipase